MRSTEPSSELNGTWNVLTKGWYQALDTRNSQNKRVDSNLLRRALCRFPSATATISPQTHTSPPAQLHSPKSSQPTPRPPKSPTQHSFFAKDAATTTSAPLLPSTPRAPSPSSLLPATRPHSLAFLSPPRRPPPRAPPPQTPPPPHLRSRIPRPPNQPLLVPSTPKTRSPVTRIRARVRQPLPRDSRAPTVWTARRPASRGRTSRASPSSYPLPRPRRAPRHAPSAARRVAPLGRARASAA